MDFLIHNILLYFFRPQSREDILKKAMEEPQYV